MKYALYNGEKTHARDVISGTLGNDLWYTDFEVVACVGKYRQYWKYTGEKPELPNGYEPESEWHSAWKSSIKDEFCEVVCGDNNEHRADIKTDKNVIEIQKSPIDGWAVVERNEFYEKLTGSRLIWIVNIEKPWKDKRITTTLDKNNNDGRFIIKWSRNWQWVREIGVTKKTYLFLDFNSKNDKLIHTWIYKGEIYGKWIKKVDFFKNNLSNVLKDEFINDENQILNLFKDL